jgi:3-dehydro-L-gulonate 2-dehydrogenase
MRVSYQELHRVLLRALGKAGFEPDRAHLCATLFADASRDGVASHGLNRFPRFIDNVRKGIVDVHARPERVAGTGGLERWDGRRGPGNLNAHHAMSTAIALSRAHGIGCVALANTNHWMRGGTFGWQAVDAGAIGICWTNTLPNLPPWGADNPRIGNNPLVIAIPRLRGPLVLDMALSQFSFGALESYRLRGEQLPVAGGFDTDGHVTRDPAAIEQSGRPLPIGFWKGSGLAIALDMIAATLSGGRATHEVPSRPEDETGLSQVFIAIDRCALSSVAEAERTADRIIEHLGVRYPGERTSEIRRTSLEEGVPVEPAIWRDVQNLV